MPKFGGEDAISQEVTAIAESRTETRILRQDTNPTLSNGTIKQEDTQTAHHQAPHTILSEQEKIFTIITASFAAFISPVSAAIYLPALPFIARDLRVSINTINLTITVYMVPFPNSQATLLLSLSYIYSSHFNQVCQALAPTFIGTFSDTHGRRPAYLLCFIIYLAANIGLALQSSYPALITLRCLQSSGSSGTVALGSAVVADIVTRAERGKYIGYASMGVTLGPALGPIIGGLLNQFLGWRSIFWFLTIFAGVMMVIMLVVFPETSRSVVGNGSIRPQAWNKSLLDLVKERSRRRGDVEESTLAARKRRPNPLDAVKIAMQKEAGMILLFGAMLYAGFFSILSSLPSQLEEKYGFNSLQIGLCYLPYGIGSMSSRWTVGSLVDWNFRRHARRLGIEVVKNRQQRLSNFPIELARLQVSLPLVYAACVSIVTYSWVMEYKTNLAGPIITLFVAGHTLTGAFSSLNTLVVDCNVESPATAVAVNNLFRCLFGAGAVAAVNPLIARIG